jgi:hypothetical protein
MGLVYEWVERGDIQPYSRKLADGSLEMDLALMRTAGKPAAI